MRARDEGVRQTSQAEAEAAPMSVRTAYWLALLAFALVLAAIWFGWVAAVLR